METAGGIIVIVQEERFRLRRDDGGNELFTLSHRAGLDSEGLQELRRQRRHVTLRCRPAAGLIAGEADAILTD